MRRGQLNQPPSSNAMLDQQLADVDVETRTTVPATAAPTTTATSAPPATAAPAATTPPASASPASAPMPGSSFGRSRHRGKGRDADQAGSVDTKHYDHSHTAQELMRDLAGKRIFRCCHTGVSKQPRQL